MFSVVLTTRKLPKLNTFDTLLCTSPQEFKDLYDGSMSVVPTKSTGTMKGKCDHVAHVVLAKRIDDDSRKVSYLFFVFAFALVTHFLENFIDP